MVIYTIIGVFGVYLLLSLYFTYLVHEIPRRPVEEAPDWGSVIDTRIPTADGGTIEVWRVEPEGLSRGIVVFVHGWSRNRDRMVPRARLFGKMGFTTVMHSARDHGGSTR
ncbi:MAG: alpha/beta hydrolase, partial [Desulfobacteraceae bacterium]|nr:alpha/beta hydrolase [Desulfobacteraceae bacterium]